MQVPLVFLVQSLIKYRMGKVKKIQDSALCGVTSFELSARKHMISGKYKNKMIDIIHQNFKINRNESANIMKAYYCNDVLAESMLGLIKISRTRTTEFNIFMNYQIFKCKKILFDVCKESHEGLKLLLYFEEFKDIKKKDKQFIKFLYRMLKELLSHQPRLPYLKKYVLGTAIKMMVLENKYKTILKKFPNSVEVKEMYGSLLINLLNDKENGLVVSEARVSGTNKFNKSFMNFTKERCFLLASGEEKSLGQILFANHNLLNYLGISEEFLDEYNLNQFIPKFMQKHHNKALLNLIEKGNKFEGLTCKPPFLVDFQGFLLECNIHSEYVADGNTVNFISVIDPLYNLDRQAALISVDGVIQSHTKNFPGSIGSDKFSLEDTLIQAKVPNLRLQDMEINKPYDFQVETQYNGKFYSNEIAIVLVSIEIMGQTFYIAQIYDSTASSISVGNYNMPTVIDNLVTENDEIKDLRDSTRHITPETFKKAENFHDFGEDQGLLLNSEKKSHNDQNSFSSSTTFISSKEQQALRSSIRVLKFAMIALLISVLFM